MTGVEKFEFADGTHDASEFSGDDDLFTWDTGSSDFGGDWTQASDSDSQDSSSNMASDWTVADGSESSSPSSDAGISSDGGSASSAQVDDGGGDATFQDVSSLSS